MNEKTMLYEEQLDALAGLVEDWAVKKDKNVKGPFTSGDYVTWRLSQIFTPAGWSFTILSGPEVVTINEANAYVRLVGRLTVRFTNGHKAHQDDIGIWPLTATGARNGGTLETTAAERYETVEKAARTDCLKNCSRNLGICFAPLGDLELLAHIKRQEHLKVNGNATRPAQEDIADLFPPGVTTKTPPGATVDKETGEILEPPTEPEETTTTGLDRLLAEVNHILAEKDLEQYNSLDTMKTMLKSLGHKGYSPTNHATMRLQLISRREPNGKKHD